MKKWGLLIGDGRGGHAPTSSKFAKVYSVAARQLLGALPLNRLFSPLSRDASHPPVLRLLLMRPNLLEI
jgi:hypothetical protein